MSETGRSCGKNSSHWKVWLKGLDRNPIVDVVGEILMAEVESDCDEVEGEEDCEDLPMPTIESGMDLPPPIDEDRQVEPALYHEQSQGGSTKSKLGQSEVHADRDCLESSATELPSGHISAFRHEFLTVARTRHAKFLGVDLNEVSEYQLSRTSFGFRPFRE